MAYYIVSFLVVISVVNIVIVLISHQSIVSSGEILRNISMFGGVFALPLIKKYDGTKGPSNKFITILSYGLYPFLLTIISIIKILH